MRKQDQKPIADGYTLEIALPAQKDNSFEQEAYALNKSTVES